MPIRKNQLKHFRISASLRRRIQGRKYDVGAVIPTELELCKAYKCSRGTVRRALDTLVNEGLIRRKQGAGHFVARQSMTERKSIFGLIVPNILNAEIVRLSQLFTLEAGRKGYRVVLWVTAEQTAVELDFVKELSRMRVAGVIKLPTAPEVPDHEPRIRASLRSMGLPFVIVNDFWTDAGQNHHVAFDEAAGIDMAVEHLVGLGHSRIGWVDGSDGPRYRALQFLRAALGRRGHDLSDRFVLRSLPYETPPVESLYPDGGEGPTALITPYDGMAVRLIGRLDQIGLCVPDDVSVVNLNGQPFYMTSGEELTTAVPPNDQIVVKALEILTDRTHEQSVCQYLFRPQFHVGRSTAPPREK